MPADRPPALLRKSPRLYALEAPGASPRLRRWPPWLLWLQTSVRQTQRWLTEANFDTVHHRSFVKIVRMEDGKFNISPTQSTLQQHKHSRMRLSETAAGTGGRLASVLPLHSWSVDDFVHGRRCLHSRAGFSRESGGCRQQSRRWQRQQSMQCPRHWSAIRSRS